MARRSGRTAGARLAAVGLAATLLLGACSSSGSSSDGGGNVTLSYGLWDKNQVPAMKRIAAAYHATHKNVTVDVQLTPYDGYFTKLQTAAGGGQAPDVFWMNGPNFQLYASNGVLAPLTGPVDTKPYPASLVKLYQYGGKQYGLPKDFDTVGLWYDKKLFDAAGLKYPDASWTWQTFEDAAKKLTVPSKGQFGTAALLTGQEGMYNTIYQAGGYVISPDGKKSGYDSPQAIKGLEFWTNLIKEKVSPDQKQMTDTAPYQMFEAGKIAMYWGGSWDAVEFGNNALTKAQADVSVLPAGAQRATVIHGLANVVFARSKHKAQAIDFAKFLGSKQAAEIEGSTGTVIPAYTGTQDAWIKAHPQFHLQSFLDELPYSKPYPVSANTAAWNTLETDILTKAWTGQEPVDKAVHELADGMNKVLAKEGK